MIFNTTFVSLFLNSSLSASPLFILPISSSFSLHNSRFSRIANPILVNYRPSTIIFTSIIVSKVYGNFLACGSLGDSPDGSTGTGCISNVDKSFSFIDAESYILLNANISLISCSFTDCITRTTETPILDIQNSYSTMRSLTVVRCRYVFAQIVSPINKSNIRDSIFEKNDITFDLIDGAFTFESTLFTGSVLPETNNIEIVLCTTIIFQNCTFDMYDSSAKAILVLQSPDIRINGCDFLREAAVSVRERSYSMIVESCFELNETDALSGNGEEIAIGEEVFFGIFCPTQKVNPSPTIDRKKYAVATIAVFSGCFAILFIGLIVLVFCKVGNDETPQYGKLHEASQNDDDVSSPDITD